MDIEDYVTGEKRSFHQSQPASDLPNRLTPACQATVRSMPPAQPFVQAQLVPRYWGPPPMDASAEPPPFALQSPDPIAGSAPPTDQTTGTAARPNRPPAPLLPRSVAVARGTSVDRSAVPLPRIHWIATSTN